MGTCSGQLKTYSVYQGIRMNQKYDYSELLNKTKKIKVFYSRGINAIYWKSVNKEG